MLKFQFRERIPIDVPHTLMQLLSRFQGVNDGLPELIKNAKDQYSRLGVNDPALRTIVIVVNTTERSIGVIDFAGAEAEQFKRWETWSDPSANASEKASDIEGGHGNGGKAFMVLGSTTDSSFESCFQGRRTRLGYENHSEKLRFKPGIALEGGKAVENQEVLSVPKQFDRALAELGVTFKQLPRQAQETFANRHAYTIAQVNGIQSWSRSREDTIRRQVAELPRSVAMHPQAALTLESSAVWFVVDGQVIGDKPAQASYPDPFPGFAEAVRIAVPDELVDPQTGESVKTGPGNAETRVLTLRTSSKSLRLEDMRPLHVIRIRNERNVVGLWSVAHLSPGAMAGFVFGELRVPVIQGEHIVGADRKSLNDTPLVRSLEAWTAIQVKDLADRIQQATAKDHRAEDRDKANQSLKQLRDLMREFLSDRDRGDQGSGLGQAGLGQNGVLSPPPPPPPRGKTIDVVEIEGGAASIAIAAGATVPLRVKAFEQTSTGELLPVYSPHLVAVISAPETVEIDEDMQVRALRAGSADVTFQTEDGSVRSNTISISAIDCQGAVISGIPDRLLLQGEHVPIKVSYLTAAGTREDLLHEAMVDEIGMGRVSRNGMFVAGTKEGAATVRVRWGTNQVDTSAATVRIGTERVPPKRALGGDRGGEIPLILLCGTPAPGLEHLSMDQRTIPPSEHYPTVIDYEPEFEHVIFINPDSKESIQARKGRGRKGVVGIGTETYIQFIALKCFDILKRLWVFERVRDTPLTEVQFRQQFATAEVQCAPFIEAAYKIADSIADAAAGQSGK